MKITLDIPDGIIAGVLQWCRGHGSRYAVGVLSTQH